MKRWGAVFFMAVTVVTGIVYGPKGDNITENGDDGSPTSLPTPTGSNFSCWNSLAFLDIEWGSGIGGEWEQYYSSKFITSTLLLDQSCVTVHVDVQKDPLQLNIYQKGIQHHNPNMVVTQNFSFTDFERDVGWLPWGSGDGPSLIFQNKKKGPGYLLRCAQKVNLFNKQYDFVIWTGLDNLSLLVWVRDASRFKEKWKVSMDNFLEEIAYNTGYKTPVVTFDEGDKRCIKG